MPVLDTEVLIRLSAGDPVATAAVTRLRQEGRQLWVPAIAAIEYLAGAEDAVAACHRLKQSFEVVHTTDLLTIQAAQTMASFMDKRKGTLPWNDAIIGAEALLRRTYVLSRNVRDFERLGIPVWNYETEEGPPI
jgi:predicted nucleic acid-binding protein